MVKLGRLPAIHDNRTLKLQSFLKALPPIPSKFDTDSLFQEFSFPIPTFSNLLFGDCVIAGRGHQTLRFEAFEQKKIIPITEKEVVDEYFKESGGADSGLYVINSLKDWRNLGWIAGGEEYNIYAFAGINWRNHTEVKASIYFLNGIEVGISLPNSAATQYSNSQDWEVVDGPDSVPASWGRHLVFIKGYDETGVYCVTWGIIKRMSWEFVDRYIDEAYAIIDNKNKFTSNSPVDIQKLERLLSEIVSGVYTMVKFSVKVEPAAQRDLYFVVKKQDTGVLVSEINISTDSQGFIEHIYTGEPGNYIVQVFALEHDKYLAASSLLVPFSIGKENSTITLKVQ